VVQAQRKLGRFLIGGAGGLILRQLSGQFGVVDKAILHLGKGGKKLSIGTYCTDLEDYTFFSEWDAYFDKDVYIGGNNVDDFVIETGTSGIWTYEKWASGKAVCWGTTTKKPINFDGHWATDVWYAGLQETFPNIFVETPSYASVNTLSAIHLFGNCLQAVNKENIAWYSFAFQSSAVELEIEYMIEATGRWK
jgi:hypothetical protein